MNNADMNNKSLYDIVYDNPQQVLLPHPMWTSVKGPDSIAFIEFTNNNNIFVAQKQVILARSNEKVTLSTVYISNKKTDLRREMHNVQEVVDFIKGIDKHKPCPGTGVGETFSKSCKGYCHTLASGMKAKRCHMCFKKRNAIRKEERRQNGKNKKRKKKSRKVQREKRALLRKVERLNDKLEQMQVKYDTLKETQIEDLTKNLPPRQKEAVLACIHCAKAKGPNGRRYTQQWMYECALLRIKSPALYRKMRRDQTLALPSPRTLQRYMKRLKPAYGFLPATFEMLEKKSKEMKVDERHGCLMFDEMCLTPCLHFNCNLLKIQGFVTLGDHTPEEQKDQPGDHALVYMFRPWKGPWFQTVGAFLSKGAVKGPILAKLSLEATGLLEKAGFHVDMWVCDGASWNRQMWTELGLKNPFTAKRKKRQTIIVDRSIKGKTSFAHPCDPDRRIYMCSDYPHLIKSLKSRILPSKDKGNVKDLVTPEGTVKFSHWEALWQADNARDKPIQRCYKLTRDHLYPHNYQTRNVGMAFTFFSGGVADAMESYKEEAYQGLEDSGPTIKFIRRVNALIDAMNANTPWDSIRGADDDLEEDEENESGDEEVERNEHGFKKKKSARQVINEFLNYLVKWAAMPGKQAAKLAHQTQYGLYVTLTSALEMSDYLINTHDFSYVMTRRMNQDAIEHFFGDVRQACGCNTHPDPVQFIQVYRLLSVASLIKPPRGSNITGGEMLNALLSSTDIISETEKQRRIKFEKELDNLLDSGEPVESLTSLFEHAYGERNKIDEKALHMFSGYVARKARRATAAKLCDKCFEMLQAPPDSQNENDSLIEKRSEGHLLKPSEALYKIIYSLEDSICHTIQHIQLHENLLFEVIDNAKVHSYTPVGCEEHQRQLTKDIMRFYITTRMIFTCKQYNRNKMEDSDKRKRMKDVIKKFKIVPV